MTYILIDCFICEHDFIVAIRDARNITLVPFLTLTIHVVLNLTRKDFPWTRIEVSRKKVGIIWGPA